jgi:hypothetical protein
LKQQVGSAEELEQLKGVLLSQVSRLAVEPVIRPMAARASMPFEDWDWNISFFFEIQLRSKLSS